MLGRNLNYKIMKWKPVKVQLGESTYPKTLLENSVGQGVLLKFYEINYTISENFPESVLSYGLEAAGFGSRGIDFGQYSTSDELTSMLNGHHFVLFDVVE